MFINETNIYFKPDTIQYEMSYLIINYQYLTKSRKIWE